MKSNKNHPEAPPKHVCMFQNPQPVVENETYTLKHERSEFIEKRPKAKLKTPLKHVCMFENPLPVMEIETYTLKHTPTNGHKKH